MQEVGIEIPDPARVRVPLWLRLQARIAPVERLLAAREAAEDEEVDDLYKRSTGDEETDRLLRAIRKEERSHSLAVQDIRSGGGRGGDGATGAAGDGAPRQLSPSAPLAVPGAQVRLDRILGRERWHRTGGGWISGAIYGANDGLAAVFGIVAGVSGATNGSSAVLTAGLAGAIASALSMATGAFLAERSELEVAAANVERERQEIAEHPEEETEELSLFYQLKGIDEKTANELAERMSQHPDAMLQALSAEEFGASPGDGGNAVEAAAAAGISTGLGAIVPVIPVHDHDRKRRDHRSGGRVTCRALPRRGREVARHPPQLVVGRARDDARRRDRRRGDVPGRARPPALAGRVTAPQPPQRVGQHRGNGPPERVPATNRQLSAIWAEKWSDPVAKRRAAALFRGPDARRGVRRAAA
jgi:hypothetical protein